MSIHIRCSNCSQILSVGEEQVGKRVTCSKCKTILQVPETAATKPVLPITPTPGPNAVTPPVSLPVTPSPAAPAPSPLPAAKIMPPAPPTPSPTNEPPMAAPSAQKIPPQATSPVKQTNPSAVPQPSPVIPSSKIVPQVPLTIPRRSRGSRSKAKSGSGGRFLLTLVVFLALFVLAGGGTLLVLNTIMNTKDGKSPDKQVAQKEQTTNQNEKKTEQSEDKTPGGSNPNKPDSKTNPGNGSTKEPTNPNTNPGNGTVTDPGKNAKPEPMPKDPPDKEKPGGTTKKPPTPDPFDPLYNPLEDPKNKVPNEPKKPEIKDPEKEPKDPPKPPPLNGTNDKDKGRLMVLDDFGNPLDKNVGLAKEKEFEGKKILVWCGFHRDLEVFFGETNPMWKSLMDKGFKIARQTGPFPQHLLKEADQLWIISAPISPPFNEIASPAQIPLLVQNVNPGAGLTKQDFQAMLEGYVKYPQTRAVLTNSDYLVIQQYVNSGKGLFLMADNEPYTTESNQLASFLFNSQVKGDYPATKMAYVKDRNLSTEQIQKFGGADYFEVKDHPLLTGVNFMYEGITVSHFLETPKLGVVINASDGKPLIGVSKVPGQRVVVDCGCTRYYYGPTQAYQFVTKTAGTIRFAENVAAYLMAKGKQ